MSDFGIGTYADLAETCGGMVLANEMGKRPLELVNGELLPWDEVFQWYVVQDPSFIMAHTDEPMFYDEELGLVRARGEAFRSGVEPRSCPRYPLAMRALWVRREIAAPFFFRTPHLARALLSSVIQGRISREK